MIGDRAAPPMPPNPTPLVLALRIAQNNGKTAGELWQSKTDLGFKITCIIM